MIGSDGLEIRRMYINVINKRWSLRLSVPNTLRLFT